MKFYLSGQRGFDNRGCEAIIRSTVDLVRKRFPGAEFVVPSDNLALDMAQWPDAAAEGVRFVPSRPPGRILTQLWTRALDRFPFLAHGVVRMPMSRSLKADIASCDAVLSTGGDIYSLDYRAPARIATMDAIAMRLGKPVFLWCASVGPFDGSPALARSLFKHLSRFDRIFVREDLSLEYLRKNGLRNVERTSDPAFHLKCSAPANFALPAVGAGGRRIGINLSPIASAINRDSGLSLYVQIKDFIASAAGPEDQIVILPHVTPLAGEGKNDDGIPNWQLWDVLPKSMLERTIVVPSTLNATEYKWVISQLDMLVAARTHATIGAFSTGIPTISLAYSIKAVGLNRDVFGHDRFVIPIAETTTERLLELYREIDGDRDAIIGEMRKATDRLRAMTEYSTSTLANILGKRSGTSRSSSTDRVLA